LNITGCSGTRSLGVSGILELWSLVASHWNLYYWNFTSYHWNTTGTTESPLEYHWYYWNSTGNTTGLWWGRCHLWLHSSQLVLLGCQWWYITYCRLTIEWPLMFWVLSKPVLMKHEGR
jgi:hypothetical protein